MLTSRRETIEMSTCEQAMLTESGESEWEMPRENGGMSICEWKMPSETVEMSRSESELEMPRESSESEQEMPRDRRDVDTVLDGYICCMPAGDTTRY